MNVLAGHCLGTRLLETEATMYSEMAKAHPSLERGMVWCRTCGRSERIDSAACLRSGWPICHGETMTIDHPSTWIEIKDGPHRIELTGDGECNG